MSRTDPELTAAHSNRIAAKLVERLIRLYQLLISPMLGPCCRFAPSCSEYSRAALQRYGIRRGTWLSLRRVARCHPFHPGGWDPVS